MQPTAVGYFPDTQRGQEGGERPRGGRGGRNDLQPLSGIVARRRDLLLEVRVTDPGGSERAPRCVCRAADGERRAARPRVDGHAAHQPGHRQPLPMGARDRGDHRRRLHARRHPVGGDPGGGVVGTARLLAVHLRPQRLGRHTWTRRWTRGDPQRAPWCPRHSGVLPLDLRGPVPRAHRCNRGEVRPQLAAGRAIPTVCHSVSDHRRTRDEHRTGGARPDAGLRRHGRRPHVWRRRRHRVRGGRDDRRGTGRSSRQASCTRRKGWATGYR